MVFLRKFKETFYSIHSFLCTCRKEVVPLQKYGQPTNMLSLNNSNLFNAMIYPFTRMVIYGAIWYQGKITLNILLFTKSSII